MMGSVKADDVTLSKRGCNGIIAHAAAEGVEFRPGIDIRGRSVAPAEVGKSPVLAVPDEISIDIGIDLDEKYGLGSGGKYTGEAVIGEVTVKGGKAFFNGQPLQGAEQDAITAACKEIYGKGR